MSNRSADTSSTGTVSTDTAQQRAIAILGHLLELYPEANTELEHHSPFEMLVATMLSAQATDVSVNAATPALFAAFPDAHTLAAATPEEVMPFIRSIGLYRTKARNITATARLLVTRHGGRVPERIEEMLELPGVGRKTANVVLANAFGRPAIAVDTHVGRLARRLGLSDSMVPDRVQQDLEQLFPREAWVFVHHALILHGRRVCHARRPACPGCALRELCPSRQS